MVDLEYWVCPKNHQVPYASWNFAKDASDGAVDADGVPMAEVGLYCYSCERPYGISKLREERTAASDSAALQRSPKEDITQRL